MSPAGQEKSKSDFARLKQKRFFGENPLASRPFDLKRKNLQNILAFPQSWLLLHGVNHNCCPYISIHPIPDFVAWWEKPCERARVIWKDCYPWSRVIPVVHINRLPPLIDIDVWASEGVFHAVVKPCRSPGRVRKRTCLLLFQSNQNASLNPLLRRRQQYRRQWSQEESAGFR